MSSSRHNTPHRKFDSNNDSGGVYQSLLTIDPGDSTACLPLARNSAVTMTIHAPKEVLMCDFIHIHIEGGQKPYYVIFASPGRC
jgi:hypothetical protein